MAWNDVYQDDNSIHLVITVGGYRYNFNNNGYVGTDLKVERKIGDTLSKFSLGVIDDGSDDYIQFERVILNRFVTINIEYGNSSKNISKYTGFVVDYQPVFLGPSTKLTVTGYITRQTAGNTSSVTNVSPYIYYIDWAPLVGARKDTRGDWDDIYNRNFFSMKVDSYGNELEDQKLISKEEAEALMDEKLASLGITYQNEEEIEALLLERITSLTSSSFPFTDYFGQPLVGYNCNEVIKVDLLPDSSVGGADLTFSDGRVVRVLLDAKARAFQAIVVNPAENEVVVEYPDGTRETITYDEYKENLNEFGIVRDDYVIGQDLYNKLLSYKNDEWAYDKFYNTMMNLVNVDTLANAAGRDYELGHVPWQPSIINQYTGNIRFKTYSHPDYPNRQISRVIPDLFVPWDKDIPAAAEYLNPNGTPISGSLSDFPDWAINDIKVFGLMFTYNEVIYETSAGNPYNAYSLLEYDLHGVKRVYTASDGYYIWVGDCPDLYQKWKSNNWNYNNNITDSTLDKINARDYEFSTTYYRDEILYNIHGSDHMGTVIVDEFKSQKAPFIYNLEKKVQVYDEAWQKEVDAGYITSGDKWEGDRDYGPNYREWRITDLEADEETGQQAMTVEERVTQYLQAAYRSGQPLMYGKIYISDIVAQLCELEGWENPKIVATAASSYKSDFLSMNGSTALEYITQQLCPNAVEDGGTGRTGFQCFFDSNGRFHFEPILLTKTTSTITLGYNIPNSPVISVTVKSRGQLLMLGIDENVDQTNMVTGDLMSVSVDKQSMVMSETEATLNELYLNTYNENPNYQPTFSSFTEGDRTTAQLRYNEWLAYKDEAQFFNLQLFNYYGYEPKLDEYINFIVSTKLGAYDLPYGTSLIRKTYKSSSATSTQVVLEALADLTHLRNTAIRAELTMVGDNKIAPGQYITIVNYTRRGKHYTSGDYYVQEITDSVTASNGFTQNLTLIRYGTNVASMNTTTNASDFYYIKSNTVSSKFEEGMNVYLTQGSDKYAEWYEDNFPNIERNPDGTPNINETTNASNESGQGGGFSGESGFGGGGSGGHGF